jgi:catechol 2,3-dioxygenase-like lactoylglutathione lyase family enzyme
MTLRIECLTIDVHDRERMARFWVDVLGWERHDDGDDIMIRPTAGAEADAGLRELLLLPVPDAKRVKNRLHLDLRPDDQEAEVARVEALGARRVDIGQADESWVVLADPEGNEFCILRSRRPV